MHTGFICKSLAARNPKYLKLQPIAFIDRNIICYCQNKLYENRNSLQQATRKQNTVIHDNSNWQIRRREW